jgi:hypothetical protein
VSPITDDDLDRLADYCAGLLGPAEQARVEQLIDTDPGWARAHAALTSALPGIEAVLSALPPEPVPVDVADRIDRALSASVAGTKSNVVEITRHRRWRRAALTTAAVAAGAVAVIGGIAALGGQPGSSTSASSNAGGKAVAPDQAFASVPPTLASGTDYTSDTLRHGIINPARGEAAAAPNAAGAPEPSVPRSGLPLADNSGPTAGPPPNVPAGLSRLADPVQLRACLDDIVTAEGGRVSQVDYARYQGAPALIVSLVGGRVSVAAAGPDCGLPGAGAAIIASAP